MDGGAWWAAVHGVATSWTRLSDFTFTFHFHALEKEMATHSSVLAWRIPGMGEPAGLPSMGSHRVGHDWSNLAAWMNLSLKKLKGTEQSTGKYWRLTAGLNTQWDRHLKRELRERVKRALLKPLSSHSDGDASGCTLWGTKVENLHCKRNIFY